MKFTILGIETSCDETSVALLDVDTATSVPTVRLRKHYISSQIKIHAKFGGVVPEVAARSHVPETVALITKALGRKGFDAFDAIAVTRGPGLATALRVGIHAAQTIAWTSGKPIVGVNHLMGHLASAWLLAENRKHWAYPSLALLVSGGHTELVLLEGLNFARVIGSTRDDAAGEAFDKSAKLLGLGYPGGPKLSKLAVGGNDQAYHFPRPMLHDPSLDFSFSGLKTSIRQEVESRSVGESVSRSARNSPTHRLTDLPTLSDLCASIQRAIIDVLIAKTIRAAKEYPVKNILLVGGVSANQQLREDLASAVKKELPSVRFLKPALPFCTDNGAMIAAAGAWRIMKGEKDDWRSLEVDPELDI
ncbi:MAG: tRNA (adenosine(37)-N6)-threonylcarbamoyltransferase complex transferase subunit TsaD [Patescibacteria group bacterium]